MGRRKKEIEMISISSRVNPDYYEAVENLARSSNRSISAYLRMIIEEHVKSRGERRL